MPWWQSWWKRITALVLWLLAGLDWAARIDFMATHFSDIERLKPMFNFLRQQNPLWIAFIGLAFIVWDIWDRRRANVTTKQKKEPIIYVMLVTLPIIALVLTYYPQQHKPSQSPETSSIKPEVSKATMPTQPQTKSVTKADGGKMSEKKMIVGKDSVVIGYVSGLVGDHSVAIGPTDNRGSSNITTPMAVGSNAHAGPGSIAIGANANSNSVTGGDNAVPSPQLPAKDRTATVNQLKHFYELIDKLLNEADITSSIEYGNRITTEIDMQAVGAKERHCRLLSLNWSWRLHR